MQEIKCPKCGEVFQVDESGYAAIAKQVRDKEFEKQVKLTEETLKARQNSDIQSAVHKTEKEKDEEIRKLQNELLLLKEEKKHLEEKSASERQTLIDQANTEKQALLAQAKSEKQSLLDRANAEKQLALAEREQEITKLNGIIANQNQSAQLALQTAVQDKEMEISKLNNELALEQKDHELQQNALVEKYKIELKTKDEMIEQYRDFKLRLSTKMIGESLEQHCEQEFNKYRATGFRNAYFEKDNDARRGSKGDYIYRDYSDEGIEFISIMFEMKNEADETATKHKNEDFFKELDKDRKEKKCEYAVLVSMLEADNEYYNTGIVDVSHKYEKMYVIRPQFFIPIITLLRNAALNSVEYRRQLLEVQSKNLDVTNFEKELMTFKEKFSYNYGQASKRFAEAIEEIDKSMQHLQKIKDALLASDRQLRLANDKAEDLSIKKLTKNAPSVREMFEVNEEKK